MTDRPINTAVSRMRDSIKEPIGKIIGGTADTADDVAEKDAVDPRAPIAV